jgi:spore germination protein YaaH
VRSLVRSLSIVISLALIIPVAAANAADRSRAVSGWFGYWTSPGDMASIASSSNGVLGEANIFWWHWAGPDRPMCTTAGGGCQAASDTPWTNATFDAARQGLQDQGVLVFATHTDLDAKRRLQLSDYLAKASRRQALADQITDWVVKSGVDGVDLDWENFAFNDGSSSWDTTRPRLNDTIARLGAALHAKNKLLSVTVPGGYAPFTSDGSPNPGGGYNVFDWPVLAEHSDRLRLMTYDYSWSRPGPIGPAPWVGEVARSAVAQVGKQNQRKIYVGLHQYGKSWYQRDSNDKVVTVGNCNSKWQPNGRDAIALSPSSARDLAASYGVTPRFDEESKEYTFDYVKTESGSWVGSGGEPRTAECDVRKQVWFGGEKTAASRTKIVADYGIGGVAVWHLASLDSGTFAALAPLADGSQPPPAPEPEPEPEGYEFSAKAKNDTPRAGGKAVIKGKLRPKEQGTIVKRQLKKDGKWRTKDKVATNEKGKAKFKVSLPAKPKKFRFRLVAKSTENHGKLRSNTVKVYSR